MVFGLLFSLLPLLLIFVVVRAITGRGKGAVGGHPVRHFFQYMLLYGLVVVSAVGLTGLLQRALPRSDTIYSSSSDLAASLAFTIVGIPLLLLMANWTRKRFAADPSEKDAFAWGVYLTFAGLTSLVVSLQAIQSVLNWLVDRSSDIAAPLATAVVWTSVWAVHWWLDRVVTPNGQTRLHHSIGSVISLLWAAVGLGLLVAAVLRVILPLQGDSILDTGGNAISSGATTFAVGAIAWLFYWVRAYGTAKRDILWDAYVMVVGVAGGLVTAVVAASVFLYKVLVWLVGTTATSQAADHFRSTPATAASIFVGLLVWWYHRAVLAEVARSGRTEGQRIYEYLVAAIGLIAAAVGLMVMFAALVETLTNSSTIAGDSGPRNTLLLAVTLLVVGAPVWWMFWHRVERAVAADRVVECDSPARRFYLFTLFGIGGTAAVISLLVAVYDLFNDIVTGDAGGNTVRSMRWALGVLLTTGAVAGYHWLVYRNERDVVGPRSTGVKYVLLAGAPDRSMVDAIEDATGAHVEVWTSSEPGSAWSATAVLAVLADARSADVVVVSDQDTLRAISVNRR